MNNKIHQIHEQITVLEDELHAAIAQQEGILRYKIEGERIVFDKAIREAHQRVKQGVFRWLLTVRPLNYFTMPIIYGMAIPLMLFDLCVSVYQMTCFPIYRIAKVKRADYIVYDHHLLSYLNIIEKAHCLYCSYTVGLLAYMGEIAARTEQYFCPIKHARKVPILQSRYDTFLRYGDEEDFHRKLDEFRRALAREPVKPQSGESRGIPASRFFPEGLVIVQEKGLELFQEHPERANSPYRWCPDKRHMENPQSNHPKFVPPNARALVHNAVTEY